MLYAIFKQICTYFTKEPEKEEVQVTYQLSSCLSLAAVVNKDRYNTFSRLGVHFGIWINIS